jgi:hypothetical protein
MAVLIFLQYTGAILGVLGSLLVTSRDQGRRLSAFQLWFVSNTCLIAYFVYTKQWGLLGMNFVYLCTTIVGLYNNRPRKDQADEGIR